MCRSDSSTPESRSSFSSSSSCKKRGCFLLLVHIAYVMTWQCESSLTPAARLIDSIRLRKSDLITRPDSSTVKTILRSHTGKGSPHTRLAHVEDDLKLLWDRSCIDHNRFPETESRSKDKATVHEALEDAEEVGEGDLVGVGGGDGGEHSGDEGLVRPHPQRLRKLRPRQR